MSTMHRICEKMHSFTECSCILSFMQVSVECIQCVLQRSLTDSLGELCVLLQPCATRLQIPCTFASLEHKLVLSASLVMWKENWLGEYAEMAYCNTLPPVEEFVWANTLLRTKTVCKKVPTSCCAVKDVLVWPLGSSFTKDLTSWGQWGDHLTTPSRTANNMSNYYPNKFFALVRSQAT